MANVIPNVGEIKFKLNDTATTLICELNTKFGVPVYGAYASKNFNRDINTGLAQTSALLEALENLKEHLEFYSAVEDWVGDTEEPIYDDEDFEDEDEDEDDDEPVDFSKLGRITPTSEIIKSIIEYTNSTRSTNNF